MARGDLQEHIVHAFTKQENPVRRMSNAYYAFFTLPTMVAFVIAFFIPFVLGIYLSFTRFTTVTNTHWVGFSNYVRAFTENPDFVNAMIFTGKFTLVAVVLINVFAFGLALLLTRKLWGQNAFRTTFFMPNLIGGIVLGYVWLLLINGVLLKFNVDITFSPKFGFWGLILVTNWQMVGYMMVIYIAAIQAIPPELVEAAQIDGANRWQILFNVTIPLVTPAFTICTFLTLSNSFKLFDQNLSLTAGAPGKTTAMMALDIYNTFYGSVGSEGIGQAKAVVFFLLVGAIVLIQLRVSRSREVTS
jgi:raffinose/stachyose/melibiose transport system permease protein